MDVLECAQSRLGEPAGVGFGLSCGMLVKECLVAGGIKIPDSGSSLSTTISQALSPTDAPFPGDVVFIEYGTRSSESTHPNDPQIIMGIWVESTTMITAIGNKVRLWDWGRGITSTAPVTFYHYIPKEQ